MFFLEKRTTQWNRSHVLEMSFFVNVEVNFTITAQPTDLPSDTPVLCRQF